MHRQTLVALSWCLVIGTAMAVLWEVHRAHASQQPSLPPAITATLVEARAPQLTPVATAAAANYSGNTNTHKFHRKTCRYYSCPNCTAKFATREEALKAGYSPCGTCEP